MMMPEFHYILWLLIAAWAMGATFDVYNTVLGSSKWLVWMRPVLDVSFWVASAFVVYLITYLTDDGQFRLYTLVIVVLGYLLYYATIHKRVVRGAYVVVRIAAAIFRFIVRLAVFIIVRPAHLLLRAISRLLVGAYRLMCRIENLLFWFFGFWLRLLFFPFRPTWLYTRPYREFLSKSWEGFFEHASNWLK